MEVKETLNNNTSFYEIYKDLNPNKTHNNESKSIKDYLFSLFKIKVKEFSLVLKEMKLTIKSKLNTFEPFGRQASMNMIRQDLQNLNNKIKEVEYQYNEINTFISKLEKHLEEGNFEKALLNVQDNATIDSQYKDFKLLLEGLNLPWLKQNLIYSKENFDEYVNGLENNSIDGLNFLLDGYYPFFLRVSEVNLKIKEIFSSLLGLASYSEPKKEKRKNLQ